MTDRSPDSEHGLVVRLIPWVLIGLVTFGVLLPLVNLALGDSKGFGADFKEGLTQGAIWGVLMARYSHHAPANSGDLARQRLEQFLEGGGEVREPSPDYPLPALGNA